MKNKLFKKLILPVFLLFGSFIYAQSVTGVVSDANGPLPGVNVIVKGTSNGTQTDFDGNYSLNVVTSDAVLVFTYVGFKTQEISIAGRSNIDVMLQEDAALLDEIVIVGYGSVRKKDATGSVETLKAESFNRGVSTSPQDLLQGRVAGVNITSASGEPGGATSIRIRGATSIRAGNNPLIVVDGVPLDSRNTSSAADSSGFGSSTPSNPLSFINPEDIASIDVLKDASATAIYGSRGANGVILITTKRGQTGKPRISVSTSFGVSEIANEINVLNGRDYAAALASEGGALGNDFGGNVNAFDAITQTATTEQYNVAFSGGTDNHVYRASFGYFEQEGIIKTSNLKKYTGSFNDTYKALDDRLKVDTRVIYNFTRNSRALITDNAGSQGSLIGAAYSGILHLLYVMPMDLFV
ncbi:MAG: SusC/RagA family TonB-linked outer membrane protein, partial [Flavobacteriaceae bacterium]|nr:SusC/RagA family TonB-linked outer membrane protein [Flavobacteriaceae bacterium]